MTAHSHFKLGGSIILNWMGIAVGALIAPLSVIVTIPATTAAMDLFQRTNTAWIDLTDIKGSAALLIFAYPIMFVIGIPAYLIASWLKVGSVWAAAAVGLLAAAAIPAYAIYLNHPHWPQAVAGLITAGVSGVIVGIAFWLVVLLFGQDASN